MAADTLRPDPIPDPNPNPDPNPDPDPDPNPNPNPDPNPDPNPNLTRSSAPPLPRAEAPAVYPPPAEDAGGAQPRATLWQVTCLGRRLGLNQRLRRWVGRWGLG